jgi:cyclophilin family peptidyl-prolyl cis-trans isomerase
VTRTVLVAAVCVLCATGAGAQTTLAEFTTPADRALLTRLIRAEDARARADSDLTTLRRGLAATNPALRRVAVRGLGRLERADVLGDIAPRLSDPDAGVRRAAAEALAQGASRDGARFARAALADRAGDEKDSTVLAAIAESMGRIQPANAQELAATAEVLASMADDTSAVELRGVVRGLFFLSRRQEARGAMPAEVIARLERLLDYQRAANGATGAGAAYIRATAAAALIGFGAATPAHVQTMLVDPDPSVREKAFTRMPALRDTAAVHTMLVRTFADTAPIVRFRAIGVYARMLRAISGCAPLVAAARDQNAHVSLAAIDALTGCRGDERARELLDSLATHPQLGAAEWHRPAHALVSLASVAPEMARSRLPAFATSNDFFVRTYIVRAARQLDDTATLDRLSAPAEHANVRSEALDALSVKLGHLRDATYVTALESTDSQVLQSAARAIRGVRNPAHTAALIAALDRVTALKRETSRDARVALLEAIRSTGDAGSAKRLEPYLRDFDLQVARLASDAIAEWTGTRPPVSVKPLPLRSLPSAETLGALGAARATIEMADGARIVLKLFPLDAPSNVWRFVRLAGAGYFEGLTWHRVVPYFVVQGGSPRANEYVGDGPFTRDEVGLENRRGTVGLSTRGRDTGDGQLYFNTVDNVRLDHDYTILAEVVSGMDVVDRIQEGAKIKRVSVRVGTR